MESTFKIFQFVKKYAPYFDAPFLRAQILQGNSHVDYYSRFSIWIVLKPLSYTQKRSIPLHKLEKVKAFVYGEING